MKTFTRLAVLWFAVFAVVSAQAESPVRVRHVFIISFDQGAPKNMWKAHMPVLKKMVSEGAHTWEAYTIVPSLTLPSHTSMLTGVGIQKHQILWNEYDPKKGRLKTVPTIFQIAKEHGLTTAMFTAKNKFRTLEIPGTLDFSNVPQDPKVKGPNAEMVAREFAGEVGRLKPNLCFIHFADPDTAGHKYGVNSRQKLQALADCDRALKIIKDAIQAAGIADSSVIIMTADHGGHDRPKKEIAERIAKGLEPQYGTHGSPEKDDVTIPWIVWGCGVKEGYKITKPVVVYDTAATALWLLHIPVPDSFWGRPVMSAFQYR